VRPLLPVTLFVVSACPRTAAEPPAPPAPLSVHCVAAAVEPLRRTVALKGLVEVSPGHHALVAAQTAGRLLSLAVREGQAVQKGALLAEVDARQAQDTAVQAKAALAAAEAGVQNARVSAERTQRLFEHGIAARQEVDDAEARLASQRAASDGARAALEVATRNVSFATVRAPLSGVVLRTLRSPGDLVDGTPATPIAELGDPQALDLLANAAPAALVQLQLGQRGAVGFDAVAGRSWPVSVASLSPMIDPSSGLGVVRLSFVGDGGLPPIGLSGEARVEVGTAAAAVVVPSTALRGAPAGGFEVLRCAEGHLQVTPVVLGAREGERVEVTQGLEGGQRVVEREVLGLDDGAAFTESR
jgi:RND family efflux transporter MFP subunit